MADTFEENLKIRLIETGAYEDQWGAVLNSDALAMLAKAVTAQSAISLNTTSYSLPAMANGAASDSRSFCLRFDGSPGGPVTVTVPATVTKKFYLVDNRCGQTITMTYGGAGLTATIANGERRFVWCDSLDCVTPSATASDASTLGGIAAAQFARRDQSNIFTGGRNSSPWITVVEAPTTVINAALGNHQRLTLTGNRTMDVPTNPVDGMPMLLLVVQDASGGRLLTWNSAFQFENGVAPTLATSPNAKDLFLLVHDAATGLWIVGHFGSVSAGSSANYNLTLSGSQTDVSLAALLGTVAAPATVNLTIAQGAVIQAGSVGSYALDCAGALPVGSVLNIFNNGYIQGRGGNGGDGAGASYEVGGSANTATELQARAGRAGGPAMRAPEAGITTNITNANGRIRGGGGGGGGGGCSLTGGGNRTANGGGGGGGAGGGLAGRGGNAQRAGVAAAGSDGLDGSSGVNGAAGTGGGGNGAGGSAGGGVGGAGGAWGAAGTAGAAHTTNTQDYVEGAGGAAGKAIELNGGTVAFVSGSGSPNVEGAVS